MKPRVEWSKASLASIEGAALESVPAGSRFRILVDVKFDPEFPMPKHAFVQVGRPTKKGGFGVYSAGGGMLVEGRNDAGTLINVKPDGEFHIEQDFDALTRPGEYIIRGRHEKIYFAERPLLVTPAPTAEATK